MSHLHIPDGVFPIWLVSAGWLITLVVLYFCIKRTSRIRLEQRLPLIGIASALMIVAMTLEIVPIAYHINMSVIAGIVLGPALGFIAVFIVDLIIAMFGHGGITVVGLNTLMVGAEVVLGYYLFRAALAVLKNSRSSAGFSSSLATIISLVLSTLVMIGVVYISQVKVENVLYVSKEDSLNETQTYKPEAQAEALAPEDHTINMAKFTKMILFLGMFGWILEAVITGLVIGYISRVRPDLIFSEAT